MTVPLFGPKISSPTPGESEYGERLFQSLREDHKLAASHARYEQLTASFDHQQRVQMLEELMPQIPEWPRQESASNEG